jgi:hypothetical protein
VDPAGQRLGELVDRTREFVKKGPRECPAHYRAYLGNGG